MRPRRRAVPDATPVLSWAAIAPAPVAICASLEPGLADAATLAAPALARTYVARLTARGVDAVFELIAGAGHVDLPGSPAISAATGALLRR